MKRIGLILMAILLMSFPLFSLTVTKPEKKIAFTSERNGNVEIIVMNADGTEQTKLTNNSVVDYTPSRSPLLMDDE